MCRTQVGYVCQVRNEDTNKFREIVKPKELLENKHTMEKYLLLNLFKVKATWQTHITPEKDV